MSESTTRRTFLQQAAGAATVAGLADRVLSSTAEASTGIPTRELGRTGERVSILCLGGWHTAAAEDEAASIRLVHAAIDEGVTFMDNAWEYHEGRAEEVMGKALGQDGYRQKAFLMTKNCAREYEGSKKNLEESLKRLQTDVIDLFYLHRYDKVTPLEDSIGLLADLVREGKVREIGLSEVSAETLRKAHAIHPIAAVQTEYSLWTREPEIAVLDACRDVGATFVSFSPVARGFLTGALRDVDSLVEKDFRRGMPRFFPENFARNLLLLDDFGELARHQGCTMGQLALAWLLHVDDNVIPIPGTTSPAHLEENFAAMDIPLDDDTVAEAGRIINRHTVTGDRYVEATQAEIDTEQFEKA